MIYLLSTRCALLPSSQHSSLQLQARLSRLGSYILNELQYIQPCHGCSFAKDLLFAKKLFGGENAALRVVGSLVINASVFTIVVLGLCHPVPVSGRLPLKVQISSSLFIEFIVAEELAGLGHVLVVDLLLLFIRCFTDLVVLSGGQARWDVRFIGDIPRFELQQSRGC
jgi:hypothetical protein